jgi:tRNA pseudouridine38-40 synthase
MILLPTDTERMAEVGRDTIRNICLTVAYDGTNYHGWQRQPNAVTVEETLKAAIDRILDHEVKIIGGARTDAGVHAMGQVINFGTPKGLDHTSLCRGLNSMLPRDIRIRSSREVDREFHARYSAKSKVYVYCILSQMHNSPFLTRYVLHDPHRLDIAAMRRSAKILLGEHDFSSFKKKDELYRNPVREVKRIGVATKGNMIYVVIEATGFLRYMVRNIVGSLLLVGHGKIEGRDFEAILESREREKAGPTAPAQGLFLREIKY